MLDTVWFTAAIWIGLAFLASLISIRLGITVALIEIFLGMLAGNFFGFHETAEWIDFLAALGSLTLTFLAGAEIDPETFKSNLKPSLTMGTLSFGIPFVFIWLFAQYVLGWGLYEAQIAGIALSTTSVAIIYAVVVEKGVSHTPLGKLLLTACFITDLGTILVLGVLFADFDLSMLLFIAAMAAALFAAPRITKVLTAKYNAGKISQPEIKFLLLILFLLAGLATKAGSVAILPSFIMGIAVAGIFVNDKTLMHRIRTISFTVFTPFFFIKAGLYISLRAIIASFGLITVLLLLKIVFKFAGVWPVSRFIKFNVKTSNYAALLMSTGITFGTISALFGLNNQIINQNQYTILVTVVLLSALIPTIIAEKFFLPSLSEMGFIEPRR